MSFQNEFLTLHGEIKKLSKLDQHNFNAESKFSNLKEQVLNVLKALFGETSREYRVVRLTNSPATITKVMNHIANRTSQNIAVNS
ncbi:hypothetical protein Desdi_0635 [Desulfitobacterium dichloroeliminans LMG P-21439]|uniref:Uncharacterized protein n=1 Tax=Desulfitobacterium dichloroeliminans (strain LMG P-21439 / DCA1) TaxID=871963 RepID=L0F2V0_DESDL|nr:hypothetical protein Desdi_0635 [Desulfitobacterium dichloroeliminans LMG P-21439]